MWQMRKNIKDGVVIRNPATNSEREQVANACVRNLHIAFPALLDSVENRVEQAYTGWPDRLYLIGVDGRVRYKSEAGPFGFSPGRLSAALASTVEPASLAH